MRIDAAAHAANARVAAARLSAEGVLGVALGYIDNAGLHRVKGVPVRRLEHAARHGVGMSPVFDTFLVDDSATTGRYLGGPSGDLRLFPDLDRLVRLAAQPGWAWAPVDRYQQDGSPHPCCQRQFARRQVERAAEQGLELRAGYEVEWVTVRKDGDDLITPPSYPTDGPAYGMHRLTDLSDYLRDVLQALAEEELTVLQIHPEYSPGQFELSLAPEDPVGAADTAVLVRATVRAVSEQHGLRASFAPVVEAGGVGNGGHLHLSLWRDGQNLGHGGPGPYGLTAEAESFFAGVLEELPALLALGAPSPASYLRLVPSHWAGAFRCWGHENREAALRIVTGGQGEAEQGANAEVKCVDQAANPYLVAGAVIAAGLAGIEAGSKLPPETLGDPAHLDPGEAPPRLPHSLGEALDAFRGSTVLREALGETAHDTVCAVREAEIALFDGRTPQEIVAATRWRY
jgi:glutamine synthetase